MTEQTDYLHLLHELPRRRRLTKTSGYVTLGSNDCPVTTEMLVVGNQLKSSLNLSGVLSELWLSVLVTKLTTGR